MKTNVRNYYTLILAISLAGLIFSAFTLYTSNGSPGGYTGSPADGKTCVQCHNGTPTPQAGIITSDVPVAGYTPGSNYTITVTVPGAAGNKKGFEVSPQNMSGALLGTLIQNTDSKLINSSKAVTHNAIKTTLNASWTFTWTAPATGTGNVTFYGAFANTENNTYTSTMVVSEKTTSSIDISTKETFNIYPNPVKDRLYVDFYVAKKSTFSITVLGTDGKKIAGLASGTLSEGSQKQSLDIKNKLSHGVYNLVLNIDGSTSVKRFVVE